MQRYSREFARSDTLLLLLLLLPLLLLFFFFCLLVFSGSFDAAFAISSLDHDGLGRYGDPINPTADVEAMQRLRCLLRDHGLLFLTVPVGPDALVW